MRGSGAALRLTEESSDNVNDLNSLKDNSDPASSKKDVKKISKSPRFHSNSKLNMNIVESPIYDPEMRKYIYNGIAQNIRVEMEKRNLNIRDLADLACVEYSHLANILKEKQQIGMQTLICVAYAMEMTPGELFPFDFNTRKSNGARFDDLTKECDLLTVNTILGIVADIVRDFRRIKHSF
ncbi:MAG: helix-turn-helix transcriptional regulator [Lachnospiraceae bacterium]|nr:helix-turn-helix transcriptional regulator [Lachnospiraceae bacterium]